MPQHRFTPDKLMKLNRQTTLSSVREASNDNINRAMGMFTSLNPTENVMNQIMPNRNATPDIPHRDQAYRLQVSPEMMFLVGVASTVVAGLLLDWFRNRS